jgi:hypothetical protein
VRGIVNDANSIQDAQEAEHGRIRGVTNALHDHLLVAGGQLAEPAAEGDSLRMRPAAGRALRELLIISGDGVIERGIVDGSNELLGCHAADSLALAQVPATERLLIAAALLVIWPGRLAGGRAGWHDGGRVLSGGIGAASPTARARFWTGLPPHIPGRRS